jgi:hypothetical protein
LLLSAFLSLTNSVIPAHPLRKPSTLKPSRLARIVIARIAGFSPGTSPPPVRMAMTPFVFFVFAIKQMFKELLLFKVVVHDLTCIPMKVQPFRSAAPHHRQTGPFFDSRKVIKKKAGISKRNQAGRA